MHIRRSQPADGDTLMDVWLRSVRATHGFLTEADVQSLLPHVRDYLASADEGLWVLCTDGGEVMGFMGMSGSKVESLFLAPEHQRRGGGRRMIQHAREVGGDDLTVDVNEQNPDACRFYQACGFVVEGRSPLDDQGRPFPLLHMRMRKPS